MNVIALVNFHDNAKDVDRKVGEEFVVTRERFDEINRVGMEKIGSPLVEETVRKAVPAKESPESRARSKRSAGKRK